MNLFLFMDTDEAGALRLLEGVGFSRDPSLGSDVVRRNDVVGAVYRHGFENDLGMTFESFPMVCKLHWRSGVDVSRAARGPFADAKRAGMGVMLVDDLEEQLDVFHP
jgi:hypothetical protein